MSFGIILKADMKELYFYKRMVLVLVIGCFLLSSNSLYGGALDNVVQWCKGTFSSLFSASLEDIHEYAGKPYNLHVGKVFAVDNDTPVKTVKFTRQMPLQGEAAQYNGPYFIITARGKTGNGF